MSLNALLGLYEEKCFQSYVTGIAGMTAYVSIGYSPSFRAVAVATPVLFPSAARTNVCQLSSHLHPTTMKLIMLRKYQSLQHHLQHHSPSALYVSPMAVILHNSTFQIGKFHHTSKKCVMLEPLTLRATEM